ncbi:MAG TPA: hypothetical protein VJ799_13235 [Nitrososphaeraceae archaeon]|nr:hypothetical protein [Nitrososphaeraceae archaeon]
MKSNNKPVFCFCNLPILFIFVVMLFFFSINGHAVTGQKPQTVSTINFTSPTTSNVSSPATISTTDTIGIVMNSIRSDNMDKLLNQTILPFMDKPTPTITTATSDNQTQGGERKINQPILTSNLDTVKGNNDQTQSTATDDSTSTDTTIRANNPIPFTDNQTVLLQFQDPADSEIINKLQRVEDMANEQATVENVSRTAAKLVHESNGRLMRDLSEIRSSINGSTPSTFQSITSLRATEIDNLTDRITSMQKSNNIILQDVSELESSVKKPSSYYISSPIISGMVAAVVSSTVIFLFLRTCKTDAGVKFSELRFRRKYR